MEWKEETEIFINKSDLNVDINNYKEKNCTFNRYGIEKFFQKEFTCSSCKINLICEFCILNCHKNCLYSDKPIYE